VSNDELPVEAELVEDDDDFEEDGDDEPGTGLSAGGFDLGDLLASAQQMQQQLLEAQAKAAEQLVEGQAGGGVVRITATGGFDIRDVRIDRSVVDPDDVEMLQDLVLAALRDTLVKVNELNQQAMGGLAGGALGGLLS
jgi:DNA-binding YbaB/EbfC family protein